MAQDKLPELHPDLEAFRCEGGLFDVEPGPLDLNVGRRVRKLNAPETCPPDWQVGEIVAVQKIYDGRLAYRVVHDGDINRFGRPYLPDEVEIID